MMTGGALAPLLAISPDKDTSLAPADDDPGMAAQPPRADACPPFRDALADMMLTPAASALDRLRIVLRHRDEGAGGSTTIAAAPLEQRYAAGTDHGRQAYDAEARLLLRH
jgi:hypothetical protein